MIYKNKEIIHKYLELWKNCKLRVQDNQIEIMNGTSEMGLLQL